MPSVVELLERLWQRDVLIESLSAELGAAQVRIAELAEVAPVLDERARRLLLGRVRAKGGAEGRSMRPIRRAACR